MIQGFGIAYGLQQMVGPSGSPIVFAVGLVIYNDNSYHLDLRHGLYYVALGETITEKGVGNGISLIIFAGIVCRMPAAIGNTYRLAIAGELGVLVILLITVLNDISSRRHCFCGSWTTPHSGAIC